MAPNNSDVTANLTYQRALDIARNTEGTLNAEVQAYLEQACNNIFSNINAQPDSYIMTKDEFAVFNFYRSRLKMQEKLAWQGTRGPRPSRNPIGRSRVAAWVMVIILSFLAVQRCSGAYLSSQHPSRGIESSLEVLQVYPPTLTIDEDGTLELTDGSANASVIVGERQNPCRQTLVSYSFANSYGTPFVRVIDPPACAFNRITWNLTVTGAGRQFDRLAIVYLGDVEVFRTSTAEPTATGIYWTYLKDMTPYLSLMKQRQTIIFDLGNIVDNTYTSPFNVTLTASFFTADDCIDAADLVLPISARKSAEGKGSVFSLPPDTATSSLILPRNIKRAVVSISATGQIDEEFWWSNVPDSTIDTFPTGPLLGHSPFREVQLFIDGKLAGVAWPFPVIFTGGVVPGLWRPLVGIDAFDLKEDEIDVTPWLGLLCDGRPHNITIRVAGIREDGSVARLQETVGNYWLVTGKVLIWYDAAGHVTTGEMSAYAPDPGLMISSSTTKASDGSNDTLTFEVTAQRSLKYSAVLNTSHGPQYVSWEQTRSFSNQGTISAGGNDQNTTQRTSGYDLASGGYARHFEYPLAVESRYTTNADNFSIVAQISRGKRDRILGRPVFPTGLERLWTSGMPAFQGASLESRQSGSAYYAANTTSKTSYSRGSTTQNMTFSGLSIEGPITAASLDAPASKELFTRCVVARNGAIVLDHESLRDKSIVHVHAPSQHGEEGFVLAARPQQPRAGM